VSTPENRSDRHNEELQPNEVDKVREILRLHSLGNIPAPFEIGLVGTSEQEDQQMRKFDEYAETHPTEIVTNGVPTYPDWPTLYHHLKANPAIYESRFVRDSYYRFDTTITAAGTSVTVKLPMVPHGKYAFLDEIHVAQVSGAGSSPNGYLTDVGIAQLFAVITPDGSTFGASYKSGRNVIPGGIVPLLTLQSVVNAANYLIGVQYQIMTKIDLPELDLASVFGKAGKVKISDDGQEAHDVYSDNTKAQVSELGPYDFDGAYQND
jgi:hypothetical protein